MTTGHPPRPHPDARWTVAIATTQSAVGDAAQANGYTEAAARMMELAVAHDGFLGVDSVRSDEGRGITVSYWRDPEDVAAWRADTEHLEAHRRGVAKWYTGYTIDSGWTIRTVDRPATQPADD